MTDEVDVPGMLRALGIEFQIRNHELWACCPNPLHNEDTPSWSIRTEPGGRRNGAHRCFGCGFEGGPFGLVMTVLDFSGYSGARSWLVERGLLLGASVPPSVRLQARGGLRSVVMVEPKGVRTGPLERWPTPAARYVRTRGLDNLQLERWGIGCGLVGQLACRLYLPTHDARGALSNWTARAYAGQKPKYLDPDVKDGANRASVFGEQYWPTSREARQQALLVLCEGELNALAFERAGAQFIGALGGSEVDPGQVLRFSSFGAVLVATDLDAAGSKIANALHALCARHVNAKRVHFPQGLDACDVEQRQGTRMLSELMREAS